MYQARKDNMPQKRASSSRSGHPGLEPGSSAADELRPTIADQVRNDTSHSLGRVLLTGAAGALGRQLRSRLRPRCTLLRASDVAEMEPPQAGEEVVQAALEDHAAVHGLLDGIDAVVHLGGISTEQPFDV